MDMPKITIGFGVALIVLGIVGYVGSGAASVTALIPTVFGVVFVGLGAWGRDGGRRAAAMHAAAALGVLGLLGTAMGFLELPELISGDPSVERPWAVAAQSIMAGLLAVFIGLCVRSFLDARRARQATDRSD